MRGVFLSDWAYCLAWMRRSDGVTAGSHPGPGYFWFMPKPTTSGSTSPGQITERRIRVISNPDQHILTGQTQIHGDLYCDSAIVSTNVEATDLVSSTRALISNVATMGTTKTFVVTVSNATGANKYYIDGELQPTIELPLLYTSTVWPSSKTPRMCIITTS